MICHEKLTDHDQIMINCYCEMAALGKSSDILVGYNLSVQVSK